MDYESLDLYLKTLSPQEKENKKKEHAFADYSQLPAEPINGIPIPILTKETLWEFPKDHTFMIYRHPRFTEIPLHMHQWIEMTYVYSGSCTQQIDNNFYDLVQGQVCLIDTKTPHAIKSCGKGDILVNLLMSKEYFSVNFLSRFSSQSMISQFILNAISDETKKENYILFLSQSNKHLSVLMKEIMCEYFSPSLNSSDELNSYLALIFLELIRSKEHELSKVSCPRKSLSLLSVIQYMEHNYKDTCLSQTAKHFSVNPSYLSTMLKNKMGFTFGELLHKIKITEAKKFLSLNDLCVTDVAHLVGYENVSFFYRIFQKETGCNPGQYRKEHSFHPTLTK